MHALRLISNALIILGLWHQAKKAWWAFLFSIVGELGWIAYATFVHDWELAFICAVFCAMAIRALVMWRRDLKAA